MAYFINPGIEFLLTPKSFFYPTKKSNTVTSVDEEIKQTDQVIFDEDGNEIDEDLDRIHRYVEEIEKEIVQQSSNTVSKEHAQSTNKNTATEESSEGKRAVMKEKN